MKIKTLDKSISECFRVMNYQKALEDIRKADLSREECRALRELAELKLWECHKKEGKGES